MVILIRSNDVVSDPRAMKYVRYLDETKQDYVLIGWDRDGKMQDTDKAVYYHRQAGYNVGGMRAAWNRIGWMRFVVKTLRRLNIEGAVLHGCDLDGVYPAIIYNKMLPGSKQSRIVYDVFDWFSDTLYNQAKPVLWAFKYMEKHSVQNSDFIIICEPERVEQIPYPIQENKLSVLPNIPYFSNLDFLKKDDVNSFDNDLPTFSYVGGFVPTRCINEIISLAERGIINLVIAGFGNGQIENRLKLLSTCPNIRYYGKVKYTDGLNIMYNSDIVYAMYSVSNPNHVYAAPNKYYEAQMLGRPLFTTKGTIVEHKVLQNGIGYVSGESLGEIETVIKHIEKNDMKQKGAKANLLWREKFSTYTDNFMRTNYQAIITPPHYHIILIFSELVKNNLICSRKSETFEICDCLTWRRAAA